jgi:hypothetical protein
LIFRIPWEARARKAYKRSDLARHTPDNLL